MEIYKTKTLNAQQKRAAESIEGPVQVIAGPGTGKTQILTSRIANILTQTDTEPWQILCLTFTEAGVKAMQQRLLEIIPQASIALKVQIHTFHSLCNQIIQENYEYFGSKRLQMLEEIDKEEIMLQVCNCISAQTPLFQTYDKTLYKSDLEKVFSYFKSEDIDQETFDIRIADAYEDLETSQKYRYQNTTKYGIKGEIKYAVYNHQKKSIEKLSAAYPLYLKYCALMAENNFYDYNDMILWVLVAFEKYPELLEKYQEQYLYVLADEFQDTNGAQYKVIKKLMSYWDTPNVFCVGDDDQSIFAFQGANIENVIRFGSDFKNKLSQFVLIENYRSTPEILATAKNLIDNNKLRLTNVYPELTKLLKSNKPSIGKKVQVIKCPNALQEASFLAAQIEMHIANGTKTNDIAVLYKKHRLSDQLVKILQHRNIPVNIIKSNCIFEVHQISFITDLMRYLQLEIQSPYSGETMLFALLHAPFFNLMPLQLAETWASLRIDNSNEGSIKLRKSFQQSHVDKNIKNAMKVIESLISFAASHQPIAIVDQLIKQIGLPIVLEKPSEHNLLLNALHTFINFIKDRNEKVNNYTLSQCLIDLELMRSKNLPQVINDLKNPEGVNFMTIFASKGLEFPIVYIIGNSANDWERGGSAKISLRPLIINGEDDEKIARKEENRRLMYVGITRAENELYISTCANSVQGKEQKDVDFIAEICEKNTENVSLVTAKIAMERVAEDSSLLLQNTEVKHQSIGKQMFKKLMQNYSLSATHFNAYLNCPVAFYYEKILRIPAAKSEVSCLGTAVHEALKYMFLEFKNKQVFPNQNFLLETFDYLVRKQSMYFNKATFEEQINYCKIYLAAYHDANYNTWQTQLNFKIEHEIKTFLDDVPINGNLDKIIIDGKFVQVVDYKTGGADKIEQSLKIFEVDADENASVEKRFGGKNWRQLMFYYFLIAENKTEGWEMQTGIISPVEISKITNNILPDFVIQPTQVGIDFMRNLIKTTYNNIMEGNFEHGCNDIKCQWCTFSIGTQPAENN